MLICVTELPTRSQFYLNPDLIAWCARKGDNPLETALVLKISGPQGLMSFTVVESPEAIAELVRWAGEGKPRVS